MIFDGKTKTGKTLVLQVECKRLGPVEARQCASQPSFAVAR